jgi:hypothetical protein
MFESTDFAGLYLVAFGRRTVNPSWDQKIPENDGFSLDR